MEKILNCNGLGISGRQNEIIELALTHKFDAVEIDMADLVGRHDALGKEFACQFLQSAKMKIGTFRLPIDMDADDATYQTQCEKLDTILELCGELDGSCCYIPLAPTHETLSFQDNFEKQTNRIKEIAAKLADKSIKVGLSLQAAPELKKHDLKFVQTAEELLSMVKSIGMPNVGICLDTWNWVLGDGAKDQLSELTADQITEVRLADIPADADVAAIKANQIAMAGETEGSIVADLLTQLASIKYEGPICILTASSMLGGRSKNRVVGDISKQLRRLLIVAGLMEGELEEEPTPEDEAAAENAEGADAEKADDKDADKKDAKDAEAKKEKAPVA